MSTPSSISAPKPAITWKRRLIVLFALFTLVLAACGDDDATETSGPADDESSESSESSGDDTDLPVDNSDGESSGPVVDDDAGYQPTVPLDGMLDPQSHPIDDVVVSADGLRLGVRYMGAAEPCSGGVATVVEDATSIVVELETGLHPNAAAMSCIAQVMAYELAVELDAPVGDRDIVFG